MSPSHEARHLNLKWCVVKNWFSYSIDVTLLVVALATHIALFFTPYGRILVTLYSSGSINELITICGAP